jgi:hypothetical protein
VARVSASEQRAELASALPRFVINPNQEVFGRFVSEFCNVQNICCAGVVEKIGWDLCNAKRDSGVFMLAKDELSFILILPCSNREESGAYVVSSSAPVPQYMAL